MALEPFGIKIHAKLLGAVRAKFVLRQHADDGVADDEVRTRFHAALHGNFLETARETAVVLVDLLLDFTAGQLHLFRVDNHHVVAAINVRGKVRLILADQHPCHFRSQTPQHLPGSVHYEPLIPCVKLFGLPAGWHIRPHRVQSHLSLEGQSLRISEQCTCVNDKLPVARARGRGANSNVKKNSWMPRGSQELTSHSVRPLSARTGRAILVQPHKPYRSYPTRAVRALSVSPSRVISIDPLK